MSHSKFRISIAFESIDRDGNVFEVLRKTTMTTRSMTLALDTFKRASGEGEALFNEQRKEGTADQ